MAEVIEKQEVEVFQNEGINAIAAAKNLANSIVDVDSLNRAADMMLEAKRRARVIVEKFKKPKSDAKAAHKSICDLENELLLPYEQIELDILKPAMAKFNVEQERKRREAEDQQRAENQRRAEDARIAEAANLEKNGQKELADALVSAPVIVPPVILPKTTTPDGISYREVWKFEIVDRNSVPREYLEVDEKKVGGVVRALKGETRIDGIRVYSEQVVAGRV